VQPTETPEDRELAWIGDAALALVARQWILDTMGSIDGETHKKVTSNQFLRSFGHPTKVEAQLGVIFKAGGLAAVREEFEKRFVPKFRELYPAPKKTV